MQKRIDPSFFLTIITLELKGLVDSRMAPISIISFRCSLTSCIKAGRIFLNVSLKGCSSVRCISCSTIFVLPRSVGPCENTCDHPERNCWAFSFCSDVKTESSRFISTFFSPMLCWWCSPCSFLSVTSFTGSLSSTLIISKLQTSARACNVILFADILHTRKGIRAVLPGLSTLTTLGHTVTLADIPFSVGSVKAASISILSNKACNCLGFIGLQC